MPAILGSIVLLFGNAFGAQATAYQLTGGFINLITLSIGDALTGDVLHEPGKGFAMAMGMIVIMAVTLIAYAWLQRRAERWRRA
jgi:putative spermidine/putrescine transport system permease protein